MNDAKLRRCAKCLNTLDISNFYNQNDRGSGKSSYCKKCFNQFAQGRWRDRKIAVIRYLGGKCSDCELTLNSDNYVVFDFHHERPDLKTFTWEKLRLRSEEYIVNELTYCRLLCANCHRLHHHHQRAQPRQDSNLHSSH